MGHASARAIWEALVEPQKHATKVEPERAPAGAKELKCPVAHIVHPFRTNVFAIERGECAGPLNCQQFAPLCAESVVDLHAHNIIEVEHYCALPCRPQEDPQYRSAMKVTLVIHQEFLRDGIQ
jgi:hypothetical protein